MTKKMTLDDYHEAMLEAWRVYYRGIKAMEKVREETIEKAWGDYLKSDTPKESNDKEE